ncbi:MAG: DUF3552 domain-containing protein, partial [Candidatus Desulforudis sp.]|nr:DUF3552 domain-containing protein [Desulforudis sp.]
MLETAALIIAIVAAFFTFVAGYFLRKFLAEMKISSAEERSRKILEEAAREAESKQREAVVLAKEEVLKLRNEVERDSRERRAELQRQERRLVQKEEGLDRKLEAIEKKEENLSKKDAELAKLHDELKELYHKEVQELERISGLSTEEARQILLNDVQQEIQQEIALLIKDKENKAREEADRRARDIISLAIQRYAADHVAES